jgi:hypothetical protein
MRLAGLGLAMAALIHRNFHFIHQTKSLQFVRRLLYIAGNPRPDISVALSILSRKVQNPTLKYLTKVLKLQIGGSENDLKSSEMLRWCLLSRKCCWLQPIFLCYAMLWKERESENIKERRKIYATIDFSDQYDFALFKYPIKFVKFLIISLKTFIKFSI